MKDLLPCSDAILISGSKLNFCIFEDLMLYQRDLTLLHLISSSILRGHFHKTNFYNASFFSTKFSNVFFDHCNLKSTDICSVWAKDCEFDHTDFGDSTISDSTFIHCTFKTTIFESVSLMNCQFVDCIFDQLPIDNSTVSLNTYKRCSIQNTHFTESFYYQIFEDCSFHDVKMNPILLGYNFGFSETVFKQLSNGINLQKVEHDLIEHGLFVNAAILCINQSKNYYDKAMIACITALQQMVQQDILIKADEIQFLKKITVYLEKRGEIAPICITSIWKILNALIQEKTPNTALYKALPHFREYANMLYFNFQKFQEELQYKLNNLMENVKSSKILKLKVVFSVAPSIQLCWFLEQISQLCPEHPLHYLVETASGSYIEIHQIAMEILPYLQTLFGFLGIITPFIIYRKEKKDQITAKESDARLDGENAPRQIVLSIQNEERSPILLPQTTVITSSTNAMITDMIKVIERAKVADSLDFCGYNAKNIQSIKIYFS